LSSGITHHIKEKIKQDFLSMKTKNRPTFLRILFQKDGRQPERYKKIPLKHTKVYWAFISKSDFVLAILCQINSPRSNLKWSCSKDKVETKNSTKKRYSEDPSVNSFIKINVFWINELWLSFEWVTHIIIWKPNKSNMPQFHKDLEKDPRMISVLLRFSELIKTSWNPRRKSNHSAKLY